MTSRPASRVFWFASLITLLSLIGASRDAAAQSAEVSASASGSSGGGSASASASVSLRGTDQKAGRFMFNLKIGPALCMGVASGDLSGSCGTRAHHGAIVFDLGFAVIPNLYLIFPFQLQFRDHFAGVFLPFGVQYDIALPVKGLFIYPRFSIGYAAFVFSTDAGPFGTLNVTQHFGFVMPEFGIKYVINKRWNVGAEPLSIPMIFNSDGAFFYYRILVYGGVNF